MPTKSEKWGGIERLARKLKSDALIGSVSGTIQNRFEAELRRRVEPLLEAAAEQCEINSGATRFNLEQELKTWK